MPQGGRKLTSKKPSDVRVKGSKSKASKSVPHLKKGAMKIAPKKKNKQKEAKLKDMLRKGYSKALEKELAEKAGADNLRVVKTNEKNKK